ncbi:MAG: hypothetical protein IJK60_10420 [Clostridia bacterium]|nr:hypothetical protein [Clostridia bacterium]
MAERRKGYMEPADYFPKDLRKKYGLGEYFDVGPEKTFKKKTTGKKPAKKK